MNIPLRYGSGTIYPMIVKTINACAKDRLEFVRLRTTNIFFMESLILAQNERWQRGLGMQVEREALLSILRERLMSGKWRKGE